MRRVSWGVLADGAVGAGDAVVLIEERGSVTEAMVKGLRRSFSHGLVRGEEGGRPR